ncbi:hypothetical protein [Streptomyces tanashiensis]|uniref:Uncharacterized protein n=1 Tax=Streptomyces tanashiensis TaxID=67367 RepID=A0ABY6QP49_9ACTN|nr:hypothetical protein [Streptomyces tanashiensis]UZX19251.1 hypothetical protein LDH80_00105 [Streptomyces tanashiensis]
MREHDPREQSGDGADATPPMYPGESTDVGGDERDAGRGRGTDTGAPTRTEAGSASETAADSGVDTGTAADSGVDTGTAADSGVEHETGAGNGLRTGDRSGTDTEAAPERDREPDTPTGLGQDATVRSGEAGEEGAPARLLDSADEEAFRHRWHEIQSRFVDDPREAVHEADALVTDVIRKLAATFGDRKKDLEGQWNEGEDVDTESLRKALRQYRSFFNRLLTT